MSCDHGYYQGENNNSIPYIEEPLCDNVEVISCPDLSPSKPLVLMAAISTITFIPDGKCRHVNDVCDVVVTGRDNPLIT